MNPQNQQGIVEGQSRKITFVLANVPNIVWNITGNVLITEKLLILNVGIDVLKLRSLHCTHTNCPRPSVLLQVSVTKKR